MSHAAHRGDVVVFRLPRDPSQTYVKRIIGTPGDKIQVRGGVVAVNGQVITRTPAGQVEDPDQPGLVVSKFLEKRPDGVSYVTFDEGADHPGDDTDTYIVPEGHYFCMGDNRDNSLDSRWPPAVGGVGFVPADNLVGKVRIVLVSWRGGASIFNPITWVARFDIHRMFKLVK
jgi:signal peptidase I